MGRRRHAGEVVPSIPGVRTESLGPTDSGGRCGSVSKTERLKEWALRGNTGAPRKAGRTRRNLCRDEEPKTRRNAHIAGQTKRGQTRSVPAGTVLGWFAHHETSVDNQEGSGAFRSNGGRSEPACHDNVEGATSTGLTGLLLGTSAHHLGASVLAKFDESFAQRYHTPLVGVQEQPARERPTPQQDQTGHTTAGTEINYPHCVVDDVRRVPLHDFGKPHRVFDVSHNRSRTEVPQLACAFQAREEGLVRQ